MRHGIRFATLLAFSVLSLTSAPAARAEELALQSRYEPGDVYALSLRTDTQVIHSHGHARRRDDAVLHYQATVIVLETDAAGRPLRERHHGVKLDFERPDQSGSLFSKDASFEVRRAADGDVQLFAADGRLDRDVEKTIERVLASQLDFGDVPALLQPGRGVTVGESWTIDAKRARRLLRERGMRAVDLDGEPAATLVQIEGADGQPVLAIRYRIPVSRWEPTGLHPNQRASGSDAVVEGELRLAADGTHRPTSHTASLVRRVHGVKAAWGVAPPVAWSLEATERSDEQTRLLQRGLAANL